MYRETEWAMKKKILLIILCVLCLTGVFYALISREPTVNSFVTNADSTGYDANLTITMNQWLVHNCDKVKADLIERIVKNDFKNMQFPYDTMGLPRSVNITVYANRFSKNKGIPAIQFCYAFE